MNLSQSPIVEVTPENAQQVLIEWFVTPDNRPIPAGRGAVTAG